MKILLLGEFSALHSNLKKGLVELGHDVTIASSGDGYKNIDRDIDLSAAGNSLVGKIIKIIKVFWLITEVRKYDVVQLMGPFCLFGRVSVNDFFIEKIINNSNKIFMLAAGSDAFYWKHGRKRLRYGPFDDALKYDVKKKEHPMQSDAAYKLNEKIASSVDGVIPIMYGYEESYRDVENIMATIPIPMDLDGIEYQPNKVNNKIVVFHGLNRYGFKGTRHVEEAFKILREKHENDLELIIDGKLPLNEYLDLMRKTNIVIDQTNSYSLGVNGIYALAMGKVVLGGAEVESLQSLGVSESPVINIEPNAQSIVENIELLLKNKESIERLGKESRLSVEEVHDYKKIATRYIETWFN